MSSRSSSSSKPPRLRPAFLKFPSLSGQQARAVPPHLSQFPHGWRSLFASCFSMVRPTGFSGSPAARFSLLCVLTLADLCVARPPPCYAPVSSDDPPPVFGVIFTASSDAKSLSIAPSPSFQLRWRASKSRHTLSLKRLLKRITPRTGLLWGGLISRWSWSIAPHHLGLGGRLFRPL